MWIVEEHYNPFLMIPHNTVYMWHRVCICVHSLVKIVTSARYLGEFWVWLSWLLIDSPLDDEKTERCHDARFIVTGGAEVVVMTTYHSASDGKIDILITLDRFSIGLAGIVTLWTVGEHIQTTLYWHSFTIYNPQLSYVFILLRKIVQWVKAGSQSVMEYT